MNKKAFLLILGLVLAVVLAGPLAAESLFVTSRICPVFDQPAASGKRLALLRQGEELTVIKAEQRWTQVEFKDNKKGWVQNIFVGSSPSLKRVGRADSMQNVASVVTRRRASAYTTSAAAARGLTSENVRERENLSFKEYNFDIIKWVERFTYTDQEIEEFARRQGITLF